jgi:hypothetical protein
MQVGVAYPAVEDLEVDVVGQWRSPLEVERSQWGGGVAGRISPRGKG